MSTGPRRIGKYELQQRLGIGGMAEVWKAFDPQLHRYVAIKFIRGDLQMDPDFMKRFEREARAVASLHHPNIIQIHDFQIVQSPTSEHNLAYMVMAYVEGQTLAGYISETSRVGKFPSATQLIQLFISISAAIDYAHQKGMIHRDVKPANILLDQRDNAYNPIGEPILTDFGIVKLMRSFTGTLTGNWLGTPLYMSPEQAQGQPGNERSDIYSLGVILYEICTGVRPFQGDSQLSVMIQHIHTPPTPPALINPAIPPALSDVILCSLSKNPEDRFPSASAMTAAMLQALNTSSSIGKSTPVIDQSPFSSQSTGGITPSSSSLPVMPVEGATSPMPSEARTTPRFSMPVNSGLNTPVLSQSSTAEPPALINSTQDMQGGTQLQALPLPTSPAIRMTKRRRTSLIVALIAIVLVLGSIALSSTYLLTRQSPAPSVTIAGHAYFESSRAGGENTNQGLNDQLQIDLHDITAADPGKSYYVWLLPDANPDAAHKSLSPLLLGTLAVENNTTAHFHYSNPQHTNLLGMASRLLVTEENTSTAHSPSLDQHTWHYYAQFSQTSIPYANGASFLDQLRNLLYESSSLQKLGLYGGLNIHLFVNTGKVLEWATSAKSAWNSRDALAMQKQIIRILDYLEGTRFVKVDLPNTPLQVDNSVLAQVPLITPAQYQNSTLDSPGDYLTSIDHRLLNISEAPDIAPETIALAVNIRSAIGNVITWLGKVYDDAKRLVKLTSTELLQPSSLSTLEDLENQANYAYNGQLKPPTQQGVVWIFNNIQSLATFYMKVCSLDSTAPSCA